MTPYEVVSTVRMLTDDMIDYALIRSNPNNPTTINTIINKAQDEIVERAYKKQDERCLRPLYTIALQMMYGNTLPNFLYPRGCTVYPQPPSPTQGAFTGIYATYSDYDEYINLDTPAMGPGVPMPSAANWTITGDATMVNPNVLLFSTRVPFTGIEVADVLYVRQPIRFNFDTNNIPASVGLSIPEEYHYEVCALAAHLLNISDVNEYQRENNEFLGAKIDFQNLTYKQ